MINGASGLTNGNTLTSSACYSINLHNRTDNMHRFFSLFCAFQILLFSAAIPIAQAKEASVCSPQILAHPIQGGYTWTVASRLGEFLQMAENEYGERDKSWTILGVEFTDEKQPSNWHPFDSKRKNIIIQLTKDAANDEKRALFQLSHEVFHVLSPTGKRDSTYLEEGLATYFSIQASRKAGIRISPAYIASPRYRQAYRMIETLYKKHPDASERIATYREQGLPLSALTETQLEQMFPRLKTTLVQKLVAQF